MTEEWRDVPEFEGIYQASSLGRIRSLSRKIPFKHSYRWQKGRILSPSKNNKGYFCFKLCKNGEQFPTMVHQVVARTFIGEKPEGREVAHKDGNPANNAADNLKYKTPSENNRDKIFHGTHKEGEGLSQSKLCDAAVLFIRGSGIPSADLAELFGVSYETINFVKKGITWKFSGRRLLNA
jgi:hypothetical protein